MIFGVSKRIAVSRNLNYPKQNIYDIVRDIARYKEFVPGITQSKIISQRNPSDLQAELVFGIAGIESRFVSHVKLDSSTITATSYSLGASGNFGFKSLQSKWQFQSLDKCTLVKLEIQLEFSNYLVGRVTSTVVDQNVERILNAFEKRAEALI
jgi:coenzyme Q-binding protein COQ10